MADTLTVSVSADSEPVVVALRGELDVTTAPQLRDVLMGLEDRDIAVDLHDLSFIDSTGLGVLAGALKRARQHGRTVVLVAPQPAVRNVLEITNLAGDPPGWERNAGLNGQR